MRRHNKELYNEIVRLTCKYRELNEVECIYLMPHTMQKEKDLYSFVLVINAPLDDMNTVNEITIYNVHSKKESRINKLGGEIRIKVDSSKNYIERPIGPVEMDKAVALRSSHILCDKVGKYTNINRNSYIDKYINSFKLPKARKLIRELNEQDKR